MAAFWWLISDRGTSLIRNNRGTSLISNNPSLEGPMVTQRGGLFLMSEVPL